MKQLPVGIKAKRFLIAGLGSAESPNLLGREGWFEHFLVWLQAGIWGRGGLGVPLGGVGRAVFTLGQSQILGGRNPVLLGLMFPK